MPLLCFNYKNHSYSGNKNVGYRSFKLRKTRAFLAHTSTGALFIKTKNSNNTDAIAYYHHDHLQTPIQATDKAGNIVWAASYDAFGKASIITPAATADKPTIESNLRLPGQYEDQETGLHYNYFRYYDTQTGRYISQDPIGLAGGVNQYVYLNTTVRNNCSACPINPMVTIACSDFTIPTISNRMTYF